MSYPLAERRRRLTYSHEMLALLTAVWDVSGHSCPVQLKALSPKWMSWIRERYRLLATRQLMTQSHLVEEWTKTEGESKPSLVAKRKCIGRLRLVF